MSVMKACIVAFLGGVRGQGQSLTRRMTSPRPKEAPHPKPEPLTFQRGLGDPGGGRCRYLKAAVAERGSFQEASPSTSSFSQQGVRYSSVAVGSNPAGSSFTMEVSDGGTGGTLVVAMRSNPAGSSFTMEVVMEGQVHREIVAESSSRMGGLPALSHPKRGVIKRIVL
ncbi:hypothetical protein EYF80_039737 [Liparis tanakae]|uniref:Uncharacterized protein n=1 Tax=Liparis tanakae TaxID=230148 RepID=A0A4Z2G961_9TELE|nr:hypothetical protein EYF80_039737 [Liparis tanakae]